MSGTVRILTNSDGSRWVSVDDLLRELKEDKQSFKDSAALIKVGVDQKKDPFECIQNAIANWVLTKIGDKKPLNLDVKLKD